MLYLSIASSYIFVVHGLKNKNNELYGNDKLSNKNHLLYASMDGTIFLVFLSTFFKTITIASWVLLHIFSRNLFNSFAIRGYKLWIEDVCGPIRSLIKKFPLLSYLRLLQKCLSLDDYFMFTNTWCVILNHQNANSFVYIL